VAYARSAPRVPAVLGALCAVLAASLSAAPAALPLALPRSAVSTVGYLGDIAVVFPVHERAGWDLALRVKRHYSTTFSPLRLLPAGPDPVSALAVALDYRSDILLVWAASGGVYAREVDQSGAARPVSRLGSSAADPEPRALISDDGRAIVAWRSQLPAPRGESSTKLELSVSGPGIRFGVPRVLEWFRDPPGLSPAPGSLRLVRLSSEAVMLAWTGVQAGRYVVRASPVSLRRGAWAPVTISSSWPADAMLTELVPGPNAEALALWTSTPRLPSGAWNTARRTIMAAQGHFVWPGKVAFGLPETISPPGPDGLPAVATTIDPYANIESSAMRIGTPFAAWRK
jgi:hypothetical protein